MIENIANNSLSHVDSYNKNNAINSFSYNESGKTTKQESFQFQSDTVNLIYSSESVTTYNNSLTLNTTKGDGFDLLRGLVLNIFKTQGLDTTISTSDSEIDLNTLTQNDAQELIADDGYFGVENTSDRIFNFAIGIAGGDPTRIDAIREGVESGFQEAYDAFGGWLPDISYDTYDAVMAKLDDWAGDDNSPQKMS